jgi:predicted DNA binding CopG/RHH family protein
MSKLDPEEKEILEAFESGKLKPVKNPSRELARHRKVAEATFTKNSRINIRISSKDLRALQMAEGMPYQTLVSSVCTSLSRDKLLNSQLTNARSGRANARR